MTNDEIVAATAAMAAAREHERQERRASVNACCKRFGGAVGEAAITHEGREGREWNVPGCCGGGCYVLHAIRFCPFCGAALPA